MASFHRVRRLRTGSTQLETPRLRWVTAHTESVPMLLAVASFKARKTAPPTTNPSSSRCRCFASRSSRMTGCPKPLRVPGQAFPPLRGPFGSVPSDFWAPQLRSRRGGLHLRRRASRAPRPSPEARTPLQNRLGRGHSALKVRRLPSRFQSEASGAVQLHSNFNSKRVEVHF